MSNGMKGLGDAMQGAMGAMMKAMQEQAQAGKSSDAEFAAARAQVVADLAPLYKAGKVAFDAKGQAVFQQNGTPPESLTKFAPMIFAKLFGGGMTKAEADQFGPDLARDIKEAAKQC